MNRSAAVGTKSNTLEYHPIVGSFFIPVMRSNLELARSCKREDSACVNIIVRKLYDIILSGRMKGLRGCEC